MLYLKIVTTEGIKEIPCSFRQLNSIFAELLDFKTREIVLNDNKIKKNCIISIKAFVREDKKSNKLKAVTMEEFASGDGIRTFWS